MGAWIGGGVIKSFYEDFIKQFDNAEFIVIVGFNILRMDIPLLIQKGVEYKIAPLDKLNFLWHNTFTIDLFQLLLPANRGMFKGLKLSKVLEMLRDKLGYIDTPQCEEHGEKITKSYEEKNYASIEYWLKQDLYAIRYLDLSGAIIQLIDYSIKKGRPIFKDFLTD